MTLPAATLVPLDSLPRFASAAKAIEAVLTDMKSGAFKLRNAGMDFEDYKRLVGYDKWADIDARFAPN